MMKKLITASAFGVIIVAAGTLAACDKSGTNTNDQATENEQVVQPPKPASLSLPATGDLSRETLLAYLTAKDTFENSTRDPYSKSFNDKALAGRRFSIKLDNSSISSVYDADTEKLKVSVSLTIAVGLGDVYKTTYYLPLYSKDTQLPPAEMENAFGVKKEVKGEDSVSYGVGGVERSAGIFRPDQFSFPNVEKIISMPPAQAKVVDKAGYSAVVRGVITPIKAGHTIQCGSYTKQPTITDPQEGTERYCVLSVHFTSVAISEASGTIIGRWGS